MDKSTKNLLNNMIVKKEEALELEQLIEKYLGIESASVVGEHDNNKAK